MSSLCDKNTKNGSHSGASTRTHTHTHTHTHVHTLLETILEIMLMFTDVAVFIQQLCSCPGKVAEFKSRCFHLFLESPFPVSTTRVTAEGETVRQRTFKSKKQYILL
ncbi:hypothetical protein XENOCAPTIV_011394 [Xenoophorus captivus]|uniref:Uncharacterized protein n=1 Tax=Xenoophorus captivus TaxID=1517983 RepID=A0ABV0Q9E2_9TELE